MQANRLSELSNLTLPELGQLVYLVLRRQLHLTPRSLAAHFHDASDPFTLPLIAPNDSTPAGPTADRHLSDIQLGVLDCLNGVQMRGQEIANIVAKGDKSKLYKVDKKTGRSPMKELEERGLVAKNDDGYFRPDAPPDDDEG